MIRRITGTARAQAACIMCSRDSLSSCSIFEMCAIACRPGWAPRGMAALCRTQSAGDCGSSRAAAAPAARQRRCPSARWRTAGTAAQGRCSPVSGPPQLASGGPKCLLLVRTVHHPLSAPMPGATNARGVLTHPPPSAVQRVWRLPGSAQPTPWALYTQGTTSRGTPTQEKTPVGNGAGFDLAQRPAAEAQQPQQQCTSTAHGCAVEPSAPASCRTGAVGPPTADEQRPSRAGSCILTVRGVGAACLPGVFCRTSPCFPQGLPSVQIWCSPLATSLVRAWALQAAWPLASSALWPRRA